MESPWYRGFIILHNILFRELFHAKRELWTLPIGKGEQSYTYIKRTPNHHTVENNESVAEFIRLFCMGNYFKTPQPPLHQIIVAMMKYDMGLYRK